MEIPQIKAGYAPGPKRRLKALGDLDRRTSAAKAAFAHRAALYADLGGEDRLSAMEKALVNNVAVLAAGLDDLAAHYLSGELEAEGLGQYAVLANAQRRLLQDLGLERRAVDVHDHLGSYLASKRSGAPEEVEEAEVSP